MNSVKLNADLNELRGLKNFIHEVYKNDLEIDLIVEEIFVNIVDHSNAEFIIVNVDFSENLTIEFIDNGIKFNPLLKKRPNLIDENGRITPRGRGIILIKHYADELEYNYVNHENHLKIIQRCEYGR